MLEAELEAITKFMYEVGLLKRYKRTGWLIPGVQNPESIAEHMFRSAVSAVIGCLLALMEGADAGKTALICLFHDVHESRIGDVPSVGRPYITTPSGTDITTEQVAGFPHEVGERLRQLVEDYEQATSLEALLARDAGKLECLLQAREYRRRDTQTFPHGSRLPRPRSNHRLPNVSEKWPGACLRDSGGKHSPMPTQTPPSGSGRDDPISLVHVTLGL